MYRNERPAPASLEKWDLAFACHLALRDHSCTHVDSAGNGMTPQFWGWSVPALSLGGYRVKVWKVPTVLAPICLVSFLGWLKPFNVQLLPSFLFSGLSAEHDHWGDKRVHKYIWCTLISNSNILCFAALTLFRDCQIFVTYGLKRAPFFLCFFLFVLTWLPLKTEQLDCYRNSPYQNTRQGLFHFLFFFVEACESSTYTALIFLILVSALWIQGRGIGYIQSLGLCFLFLVAHPGSLAHGGRDDAAPQGLHGARSGEAEFGSRSH